MLCSTRASSVACRRREELDTIIAGEIGSSNDMQYVLDRARVIGSEQQFLIGVRVLSGAIKANQAGGAYALLAERMIDRLQAASEDETRAFARARCRAAGRPSSPWASLAAAR